MRGICQASGEIDLATVPAFAEALRDAIDGADASPVFVDCAAITFMDSSAFHALVAGTRYSRSRDRRLTIRDLNPNCARVLDLCDWDDELTIEARPSTPTT